MPQSLADFMTCVAPQNIPTSNIVEALNQARALTESRTLLARTSQYCQLRQVQRNAAVEGEPGLRQMTLTQMPGVVVKAADSLVSMCCVSSLELPYKILFAYSCVMCDTSTNI